MPVYSKNKTPCAAIGCETRKRPPKPKDNLALDAMDARKAGQTYGKWKVNHPNTKEANEPRLAAAGKKKHAAKVLEVVCMGCGKTFTTENSQRRYCTDECKKRKDRAALRAKNKADAQEADQ